MESIEGNKLIVKLQKDVLKKGIVKESVIKDLKELRNFALEDEDPTLTKVIRLTYEHIEDNGTFNIPIPEDEEVVLETEIEETSEEAVSEKVLKVLETDEERVESLNYLFSLMLDRKNSTNREEMFEYRDSLKAY